MKPKLLLNLSLVSFLTLFFGVYTLKAQVVINEWSASNISTVTDNYGENEDWIELYNTTASSVDLTGWYVSDKTSNPTKWQIPSGSVPANGYLVIWASGRNEAVGGNIHTGFKLTQTKPENIIISDAGGNQVDALTMDPAQTDHSRGRTTDGDPSWSVFPTPTPGASNTNPFQNYATTPIYSIASGAHGASQTVDISSPDANVTIYYTLDGSEPTAASTVYTGSIAVATTQVVRARSFSSIPDIPASFIETNTYLINENHTIPVLSISGGTGIADLFGGSAADPDCTVEYFNAGGALWTEGSGQANKHGNDSWAYDQRGIDYIVRDQYGYNYSMLGQIFRAKNRSAYQRVILKAAANDNYPAENGAHIRDSYVHSLSQVGKLKMDERTHESCILYVNGQYWGVYDIREKVDDLDFTDYYYDQGRNSVYFLKTWGGTWEEYGAPNAQPDWDALRAFILANDMSIQANWDYMDSLYNWQSLVDYFVLNSYIVSQDWLNWNTAWWRGIDPAGDKKKWRYVLWDMDATFGHYINYTGIPDPSAQADPCNPEGLPDPGGEGHTLILNKLRENPIFEQWYISRFIDLSNTVFTCDNMINHLDSLLAFITPEMPRQITRWGGTVAGWQANVQTLKTFINDRCASISQGMLDCYPITGPYTVTYDVDPPGAGDIKVNSIWLDAYPWTGTYYGGIDILLRADANNGYEFDYWEAVSGGPTFTPHEDSTDVSTQISANETYIAHFKTEGAPSFEGAYVPTAFSPNNDGTNDILFVLAGKDIVEMSFTVFNRWGEVVFETDSPLNGWDGTFNGELVNSGVFAYMLKVEVLEDGQLTKLNTSGNITLMR
jgi:gliding motility-associated-like protein